MKLNKTMAIAIIITLALISLLTISVTSQISQTTLSLQENKDCATTYYNKTEYVYGYANKTRDTYGDCIYPSNQSHYTCVNGTEQYQVYEAIGTQDVLKNKTDCISKSYTITITKSSSSEKKEIDFSQWGVCVYNNENNCLIVTCQSIYDGANDGQFHGCKGGTSCQRFEFCDNGIKVSYKNSRSEFVEVDPTFNLPKLALKEVEE